MTDIDPVDFFTDNGLRTSNIWIGEDKHGPADKRRYDYLPTFILRGLTRPHVRFE
ncbi:hypothetical protein [Mycobacterium mantenii]|uniref:hypothetical protein n=1 Tax=Mycobacterium mantenii TaxID=560555 RepID=UPI000B0CFF5A|nr:hypothetical protein [Mycobacterium mantenii]